MNHAISHPPETQKKEKIELPTHKQTNAAFIGAGAVGAWISMLMIHQDISYPPSIQYATSSVMWSLCLIATFQSDPSFIQDKKTIKNEYQTDLGLATMINLAFMPAIIIADSSTAGVLFSLFTWSNCSIMDRLNKAHDIFDDKTREEYRKAMIATARSDGNLKNGEESLRSERLLSNCYSLTGEHNSTKVPSGQRK